MTDARALPKSDLRVRQGCTLRAAALVTCSLPCRRSDGTCSSLHIDGRRDRTQNPIIGIDPTFPDSSASYSRLIYTITTPRVSPKPGLPTTAIRRRRSGAESCLPPRRYAPRYIWPLLEASVHDVLQYCIGRLTSAFYKLVTPPRGGGCSSAQ